MPSKTLPKQDNDPKAEAIARVKVRHEERGHVAKFNPLWELHDDSTTSVSCCEELR